MLKKNKIFLTENELAQVKEKATRYFNYETGKIEQAWMSAFNEVLVDAGVELIMVPNSTYTGSDND